MAENEKKDLEKVEKKAPKAKEKKPSAWKRIGTWFKSLRSECKKISWTSWKSVKSSTFICLVCVVIFAIVLGVLDLIFGQGIVGLKSLTDLIG